MNKNRRQKQTIKTVPIDLNKRQHKKKSCQTLTQSRKQKKSLDQKKPELDKFKLPLTKLKKTFQSGTDVFEEIRQHSQLQKLQLEQKKQIQEAEGQSYGEEQIFDLTQKDFQICKCLFEKISGGKEFIEKEDLESISNKSIKRIVQVIIWRQDRSNLVDFIYALWDSGRLHDLCQIFKN